MTDISGRIVIAGGTGFLGLNLVRSVSKAGGDVVLLSRHPPRQDGPWTHARWDGRTPGPWEEHLDGAAALVNLAGRSVDCVKTPEHVDQILRSRVEATRVLGQALRRVHQPPPVWVQMSTAHRYGDSPDVVCDEDAAPGYGLAPFVAEAWEGAYRQAVLPGMRRVILRTSFVLGTRGGALPRLAVLARWGMGGRVGHGRQGISWIHEHDMNRLFVRAVTCEHMNGVYLATAPQPVSNARFMHTLRRSLRVPLGLPTAGWMVRWGAPWVMRTDPELALYGRYCISRRLPEEGFDFRFPELSRAMEDLYRRR